MDFVFQRSYRGPIKAVILDWAGTAVDHGSFAPTAVFLRLFERQNVSITPEDARYGMGLMKMDHLRMILSRPSVAEAWKTAHGGAAASEDDIQALFQNFIEMQIPVLEEFSEPIPGLLEVVQELHDQGVMIGSTTGYIRPMMDVLAPAAAMHGYLPDCIVCPDDVPAGRPYPWMCYQNAMQLGVFPMQSMVKVGDTLPDIEEGLNAGMWSVGLSLTGNLLGMSTAELEALSPLDKENVRKKISGQLYRAGAHYVIDGIWDLPVALEKIQARMAQGERP